MLRPWHTAYATVFVHFYLGTEYRPKDAVGSECQLIVIPHGGGPSLARETDVLPQVEAG